MLLLFSLSFTGVNGYVSFHQAYLISLLNCSFLLLPEIEFDLAGQFQPCVVIYSSHVCDSLPPLWRLKKNPRTFSPKARGCRFSSSVLIVLPPIHEGLTILSSHRQVFWLSRPPGSPSQPCKTGSVTLTPKKGICQRDNFPD